MIRRSRLVYSTTLALLVYIIIFSILGFGNPRRNVLSGYWREYTLDFSGLRSLFVSRESYSFDRWVRAIFREKAARNPDDPDIEFAMYVLEGPTASRDKVKLPEFLWGKGENPGVVPHDPRLTLGMILSEFNAQIAAGVPTDKLEIPHFHWADWTDMTLLDRKILSVKNSKATCESLNPQKHEQSPTQSGIALDSRKYCFDDADIRMLLARNIRNQAFAPYLQKILSQPYTTGIHVFRCPVRASPRIRKMAAVSYLNDFMPAPLAVHFILPTSPQKYASLHVPVNQDIENRDRLINTPLATSAAKRGKTINLRKEVTSLAAHVNNKGAATNLKYEKEIAHEDFVDDSKKILEELGAKVEELNFQEKNYFNSLQQSVRTKYPTKYFYEALLVSREKDWQHGGHHDWRFFKGIRANTEMHAPLLHGLISAWLRVTNANNMTTWIAHGSLLGWYWNGISFPWDADYDVQMPIADLHKLSRQFNQTVIVDFGTSNSQEVRLGRYFLDCGTWVSHRGPGNGLNNIDARFIDMDSGLYIDITGLAVSPITAPERYESQLPAELQRPVGFNSSRADPETEFRRNMAGHLYNCRNRHFSSLQEISPLRLTLMEGVPAYIPNNFTAMLEAEYSARGINGQIFRSHTFLPRLRLWVPSKILSHYSQNIQHQAAKQVDLGDHVPGALEHVDKYWIYEFSDQDYLEMMNLEKEMLFEYLVTKDTTVIHQEEMELLLSDQSTEDFFFEDGVFKHKLGHLRRDINNYMAVKQHREFPEKLREYMDMYQSYKKGEEYVGSDQLPIPAPQALSPIRLQSPGQGLTRNRMG